MNKIIKPNLLDRMAACIVGQPVELVYRKIRKMPFEFPFVKLELDGAYTFMAQAVEAEKIGFPLDVEHIAKSDLRDYLINGHLTHLKLTDLEYADVNALSLIPGTVRLNEHLSRTSYQPLIIPQDIVEEYYQKLQLD